MPIRNIVLAAIALTTLASDSTEIVSLFTTLNALAFSVFAIIAYFAASELAFVRSRSKAMLEAIYG